MKVFVIFSPNMLMKTKMNLYNTYENRKKLSFFNNNKLKFQPRT